MIDVSQPGDLDIPLANGVIVSYAPLAPTGTGVFDPFLRLQMPNTDPGTEQGVNTSLDSPNMHFLQDKPGPNWTHDLAVSTLQTVTVNGGSYYQFSLDANQIANGPLSVNTVRLYMGPQITSVGNWNKFVDTITGGTVLATPTGVPSGYTLFDALQSGAINYDLIVSSQHGSGSGDLTMYIPVADVTGPYLYFFNENGVPISANDGFEEWSALVPDATTTMSLLGFALVGIEGLRRKLHA